jgi:hypothetical protein
MSVQSSSASRAQSSIPRHTAPVAAQAHHEVIETAAYYLAERRGFAPGSELDDWLTAEASIRSSTQSAKR